MTVRETSRASYKKLNELGEKQQEVFSALKAIEPASDRDIAKHLGVSAHYVSPRRGELSQWGFVVEAGHAYDNETQRKVIVWATTDPMANRQIQKAVGKPEHTEEKKAVKKYSLKLKDGKSFIINQEMKDEIEASMAVQRGGGGSITLANQVFRLSNIIIPIREVGEKVVGVEPVRKEDTREVILIEQDGTWTETNEFTIKLRNAQTPFRTRRVGVETGHIHSDMLTHFPDGYETLRDMKGQL